MKKNMNKLAMMAAGLLLTVPSTGLRAAQGGMLSADAKENLEMMGLFADSLTPLIKMKYMKDPIKQEKALKIIALLKFIPNLAQAMEDLKRDVPQVPAESLDVYKKMLLSLKQSQDEFNEAKASKHLDEQTQNVLAGLDKLNNGLVAPGDYLISLNDKTFKKILELFEALPGLDTMMRASVAQGGTTQQVALSKLVTNMFTKLQDITKKYTAGLTATNLVVAALLKQNAALKAEIALQSQVVVAEQASAVVPVSGSAVAPAAEVTRVPAAAPSEADALDLGDLFA